MLRNKSVLHFRSFAKYAAAFFKMAFSSKRVAFILLSRLFSSMRDTMLDCNASNVGWPVSLRLFMECPFLNLTTHVYKVCFGIPSSFATISSDGECRASWIAFSLNSAEYTHRT